MLFCCGVFFLTFDRGNTFFHPLFADVSVGMNHHRDTLKGLQFNDSSVPDSNWL